MPTIYVEDKPYAVPEGLNLLRACLSLGFDIPYFCWHPAMHSVGACRLCAVKLFKDEHDTRGKLVMSCMELARDGTRISIADPDAVRFRRSVLEWLMLNHPHDCPVCDEGGECHLQDMTQMTGHVYRRNRFPKRTYRNQYLGPFLTHEMNRCIQCYRCVRFYRGFAGGRDFHVLGWHDDVYFGRHEDGILQSKFSGNLVEVCPTGVFDDKTQAKHYVRKWDLQTAPSICVHCGLGCNTIPGERYGTLRRIRNRYNGEVNGYFLCDRGRYGYEFVNSPQRLRRPLIRDGDGRLTPAAPEAALAEIGRRTRGARIIGIGSARASLESNFALRCLVGPENFYAATCGVQIQLLSSAIEILRRGPVPCASACEASFADSVLVLGEDISSVMPILELSLRQSTLRKPSALAQELHIEVWNDAAIRQAIQTEKGPLYVATTHATDLDAMATRAWHAAPQDIARLGFAVAHRLDAGAPAVPDLPEPMVALVQEIAEQLADSQHPLIVSGVAGGTLSVLQAAANVALALHRRNPHVRVCFALPWCNSMGLGLLGGRSLESVLEALRPGGSATLVVLETDLYHCLDAADADELLHAAHQVVVLDSLASKTTARADFVLPAATFAESTGTLVNYEGRAQRSFRVFEPGGDIRDSWRWLGDLIAAAQDHPAPLWWSFDDVVRDLTRSMPTVFGPVSEVAPPADFRVVGQRIARQPHRYSGRTAIHAAESVHEPQPPRDLDAPLAFSMEGYPNQPPPSLIPRFWTPGWNSVQSLNKFQEEVGGPLRGGNPGKLLIAPQAGGAGQYFTEIPAAFERRAGHLLVVPGYHAFGSEELSALSSSIAELAVRPYLAVNPADAAALAVNQNGWVDVTFSRTSYHLPVQIAPTVPPGLAVVPIGLPGLPWDGRPVWKKLLRG